MPFCNLFMEQPSYNVSLSIILCIIVLKMRIFFFYFAFWHIAEMSLCFVFSITIVLQDMSDFSSLVYFIILGAIGTLGILLGVCIVVRCGILLRSAAFRCAVDVCEFFQKKPNLVVLGLKSGY